MLIVYGPSFEVVREGRILHFVSGYGRFALVTMAYDKQSSLVDKRFEISNHTLIRDMNRIIRIEEVLWMK